MTTTVHNLGFPRVGAQRELKFVLERYWRGEADRNELATTAAELRARHWRQQAGLDRIPVGDFSFYDHVLDTSFLLGHLPRRFDGADVDAFDNYFRVARGHAGTGALDDRDAVAAGEMTKWFDTNYHYIVPELDAASTFSLNPERLLAQLDEALGQGVPVKPVIIGPLTYLSLGKVSDGSNPLDLLDRLVPVYADLLARLAERGVEWVQLDEPVLVTELSAEWQRAFERTYFELRSSGVKCLLTTYFGKLGENLRLACELPVAGLHLDAINAREEITKVLDWLSPYKVLSLGVVNGRNVWKSDLSGILDWLEPVKTRLGDRLWLAPSCSLLHVPFDLSLETELDLEIANWLAFAVQKLDELKVLGQALDHGRDRVATELTANHEAVQSRRQSRRVHKKAVQERVNAITTAMENRRSPYEQRAAVQRDKLQLPAFPTTTIGSFPQTAEIRRTRLAWRRGELSEAEYRAAMKREISACVDVQHELGLDVLVHGEAERNDMVEYFGQLLDGFAFTRNGWVQSYGSRCVKPPLIFGDIERPAPMTVEWTRYAQSLTDKPMKGMLTGPVTLLNWSFVRDDQPRSATCLQLALAVRDEVQDLERAGTAIIQIDEAALREGLPLRRAEWPRYLEWAVRAFRIAANGVTDDTQIHTHMCYSEFNDIIESIAALDADVITIETARSGMELLRAFDDFRYPNEIGPGVYDIHSPNVPQVGQMVKLMREAAARIPAERLWVNPDCGLKTRGWAEVKPALESMVAAARQLRA